MKFQWMLLAGPALFFVMGLAASEVRTIRLDVATNSESELLGTMSLTIDEDAFPDASPTNPVFLEVSLERGATLRETLVDQRSGVENLPPIFLPMRAQDQATPVVAPRDTLSIVRWIAGESRFWLKVQRSSSRWLGTEPKAGPPSFGVPVVIALNGSARAYWEAYSNPFSFGVANLPYATTEPDTANADDVRTAVSVNFCGNLIGPNGSVPPFVRLGVGLRAIRLDADLMTRSTLADLDVGENHPFAFRVAPYFGDEQPPAFLNISSTFVGTCSIGSSNIFAAMSDCDLREGVLTNAVNSGLSFRTSCHAGQGPYDGSRFSWRFLNDEAPVGFRVRVDDVGEPLDASAVSGLPNTVLLHEEAVIIDHEMTPPYAFLEDLRQVAGVWLAKSAAVTYVPVETPEPDQNMAFHVVLNIAMTAGVVSEDLAMNYVALSATRPPQVEDPRFQGDRQGSVCPVNLLSAAARFDFGRIIPCDRR